jgi:hypothetical protein
MTSVHAQSTAPAEERVDAFQEAFGMSFYFDGCGDRQLGELYRRALLDKLARCPFSDEAKRSFRSWASSVDAKETELVQRNIKEHGKLPDRLDGMKETCQEHRESPNYLKIRELLHRYARGEISADAIVFSCDTQAGAP